MSNKTLIRYVKEQIEKGYDAQTLRKHMLKYGYAASDVDKAISQAYGHEVKHVIHFSPATMVTIAGVFIGLVVISFVFYNLMGSKTPETLLDLNLEGVKTTSEAGSDITFLSEIDNLGSSKRYDVILKYEVINIETSKVITFKEETRALETKSSKQININVPSDAETGDYVLRAIATYDGQRAVATIPVKIQDKDSGSVEEPVVEEPVVEIPDEEVVEEVLETVEEESVDESRGDDALTTFETLEKVEVIAKQNKREAEKLCEKLVLQTSRDLCFNKMAEVLGDKTYCGKVNDERTKDVCLGNVAKIIDKSEICEEITKDSRKDSCYMSFVTGGKKDYSVCDKVVNQYLKQSCESLKQLSKLNITDVAFYETLINQSLFELV